MACGAATAAGFAGALWWGLDLLAHFRVQYLAAATACAIALALLRRSWALVPAAVVAVNAAAVAPLFVGTAEAAAPGAEPLRLVSFNVHRANPNHDEIARYLHEAGADLAAVLELTPEALAALKTRFPDHVLIAEPRTDSFGIALISRLPLRTSEILHLGPSALPAIAVSFERGGERYDLLALHPLPPVSGETSRDRDAVLAEAARWARSRPGHAIVLGDLNATPWSHAFRALLERGQLESSQRGRGLQASWPRDLWPLSIAIDHCLHGRGLVTVQRRLGPFLGSDHRPLHVSLAPRRR